VHISIACAAAGRASPRLPSYHQRHHRQAEDFVVSRSPVLFTVVRRLEVSRDGSSEDWLTISARAVKRNGSTSTRHSAPALRTTKPISTGPKRPTSTLRSGAETPSTTLPGRKLDELAGTDLDQRHLDDAGFEDAGGLVVTRRGGPEHVHSRVGGDKLRGGALVQGQHREAAGS
jgi:hypothetical protein